MCNPLPWPQISKLADPGILYANFAMAVEDVAGSLRSALDQFAWQLACGFAPTGEPPDPRGVKFPIDDLPVQFAAEKRARKQIAADH